MTGNENLIFTQDAIFIKETMELGEAVIYIGELKYSIFNGVEFYNKINTNKLI